MPKSTPRPMNLGSRPRTDDWIARVVGKVKIDGNGCWIYGTRDRHHHKKLEDVDVPLHRLVYGVFHNDLDDDLHVHHTCEQPACINPAHLVAMSRGDHIREHHRVRRQRKAA